MNSRLGDIKSIAFIFALACIVASAWANGSEPKDQPILEKIWSIPTLYKNEENRLIQELRIIGRYQGQYHWLDSAQGQHSDWDNRRVRIGISAKFFHELEFLAEAQSSNGFDPVYNGFTDFYLRWKPTGAFNLTVGRQKTQFGWDWLTADTTILPFERSQIFNQTKIDRAPGVVITGKLDDWSYEAGIYSNQVDKEFGSFSGGVSLTAGIGYDFKKAFGMERADWRLDCIHSEINSRDTVNNYWRDAFSTSIILKQERAGLVAETIFGSGKKPGAFGFYLMPTFDIVPQKLQLVARYSYSNGNGPDSIVAQKRYEQQVPNLTGSGKGSSYQAGYLGLQYFIHGEKLKLMAGTEYAQLKGGGNGGDYNGWTMLTGVRFFF